MRIWDLVIKEIRHHKFVFVLCLAAVIIATGILAGELTVLKAHDMQTDFILAEKEKQVAEDMKQMEDYYRSIMKEHGFSLLILPEGQNLGDFYAEGYASKFMPEEYVERLAESNLPGISRLLPAIEQKIRWTEEYNRTILLTGIRGEVLSTMSGATKPRSLVEVAPGNIALGYELWDSLGLKVGDEIELLGENFEVSECCPQRGTKKDIAVWTDLGQAQRLLGKENQINQIWAVQTYSPNPDFSSLRADINRILPNTQVIISENEVTALAKAINRAKATAEFSLAAEQEHHSKIRGEMETFASWLIPLVFIVSMALIGMLTLGNVRERRQEIAILRTLGYRSRQVLQIFLAKAFLLGVIGAFLGYAIGFVVAVAFSPATGSQAMASLFDARILLMALAAAPVMSLLASWVPAMVAARQDPADILKEVV